MSEDSVLYTREGSIGIITLNRPECLNAINQDLLNRLIGHLNSAREDTRVITVMLTGAGKSFCAGEDLKETSRGKTLDQWHREIDALQEFQRVVLKLGKPLVAAVNGYAVGGGLEFALSCDMRIASRNAKFGFPETSVGLTVTSAGTKLISQLVGLGKAKELIFTGEFVDAPEALRIGLVNRVVPADRLLDETMALCRTIARRSPLSLRLSRIAIDQGLHASFEQILEIEASHLLACVASGNQEAFVQQKIERIQRGQTDGS